MAIVSRPGIDRIKGLRGKKIGINSFRQLGGLHRFCRVDRSGLDPYKDVTILMAGGGNVDRIASVLSGSIDATVVSSPFEHIRPRNRD